MKTIKTEVIDLLRQYRKKKAELERMNVFPSAKHAQLHALDVRIARCLEQAGIKGW